MHPFSEHVNPHLGNLLESIKLDKSYVKGEGCLLYDEKGNQYLDFIAAYGALPFGHNPPGIWEAILDTYREMEPGFIQPSKLNAAGELAQKLVDIAPEGFNYATFTNSGAEAVEAAIKLCRSATGKMGILSTENSFHGKTMGALSATGNPNYQQVFGAPLEHFNHIEFGDAEALEKELENNPDYYAAFFVEPIQGEGGIVEPPEGYLRQVKEICDRHEVLLVLDEIQTGLGRTGYMFACEKEEVNPDVILLAKALSGGIIPIGVCLSNDKAYNDDFAEKHSSTFAGNTTACRAGIKALEMLTANKNELLQNVKETGAYLQKGLISLQEKYPGIIRQVRGQGLMLGLEFDINRHTYPSSLLGIMAEQEMLTPVLSSYLLNVEKVRVAPTLNGNRVIRIEPPLHITKEQCDQLLAGLENMLQILNEANTARLLSFLIDKDPQEVPSFEHPGAREIIAPPDDSEGRFAFLIHPIALENYSDFDPSLAAFTEEELERLTESWNDIVEPFVISEARINSKNGDTAYGEFIVVPRTAEELSEMPRQHALGEIKHAIGMARERGAKIVGLGAFTAVVSMGGLYLKKVGVPLTTGNSYTVVSAAEAVNSALEEMGEAPEEASVAVIGAAGSIGKGTAVLMAEKAGHITLIGNPQNEDSSINRLSGTAAEIYRHISRQMNKGQTFARGSLADRVSRMKNLPGPDAPQKEFVKFAQDLEKNGPVRTSTDLHGELPHADVVISATNATGSLISSADLKSGALVCEISRPSNISDDVLKQRADVLVIEGGVVEVPGLPSLGWDFGFDTGLAYACMSETMMLALEQDYRSFSLGSSGVTMESILYTQGLAHKHGFKLASLKSFDLPITDEKWASVIQARNKSKQKLASSSGG